MAVFKYSARDANGKKISGSQEALSANVLLDQLTQKGFLVTKLEPAAGEGGSKTSHWTDYIPFTRVSDEEFIFFNYQLANMMQAGLPLLTCLRLLALQVKNRGFRRVLNAITQNVEEGNSFSQAAARHPHLFSDLFVSLMVAGEASGNLDTVLERFAKLLDDQLDLQRKIRSAIAYPIVVIIVSMVVVGLMLVLVIPQFIEIFAKANIPLPWPTLFLYRVSTVLRRFWPVLAVICFSLPLMLAFIKKTSWGRWGIDLITLKLPIFGSLLKKGIMSRWTRTFGTLIAGGVAILPALAVSRKIAGNSLIEKGIDRAYLDIEKGGRLADSLKGNQDFPLEVVQMINVGEESGTLDNMLMRIADFYDKALSYQVKRLTDMIEPVFLIGVGSLVAFIMISVLLPIFDMINVVQKGGF